MWSKQTLDGKVCCIKNVYEAGMSASKIAGAISKDTGWKITRNMIIGLYTRHADLFRGYPLRQAQITKKPLKYAAVPWRRIVNDAPPVASNSTYKVGKQLKDLKPSECKFAVRTEGRSHLFCGEQTGGVRKNYCELHNAMCFTTITPWGMQV